jgi:predicted nucleic acid-binding protein
VDIVLDTNVLIAAFITRGMCSAEFYVYTTQHSPEQFDAARIKRRITTNNGYLLHHCLRNQ